MISQFISGSKGPCFISVYLPETAPKCWVLCFPPFAEEMNKCRTMMSAQARVLVAAGVAVVIPDLYGTGDSGGDFSDAEWKVWLQDMVDLTQWIRQQGGDSIHFWGIRLGCLLALDTANKLADPIKGLILWQPVASGQQVITQFLRLRMASSMMGGTQEKVGDLRARLENGDNLEVAGYELSPSLAKTIDGLSMLDMVPKGVPSVAWFEVSGSPGKSLSVVSRKIVEAWRQADISVDAAVAVGEPFWMTQEISMAPALIQCTKELFASQAFTEGNTLISELTGLKIMSEHGEQPIQFDCEGEVLSAVLHRGENTCKRGVLIVVGGPQYRVGSHRQFILLARELATEGIPVFRFDCRGMGDSSGDYIGFEGIGKDIRAATDCFQRADPQVEEVVIWGLCDAATAATFFAPEDERVTGLVLLNPWVRSEQGEAKAYIKHYYFERLLSKGFWSKIITGNFDFAGSLKSLGQMVSRAVGSKKPWITEEATVRSGCQEDDSLIQRMEGALSQFTGKVMLILSGNDLTAAEFIDASQKSKRFRELIRRDGYKVVKMDEADHTFSRKIWKNSVTDNTVKWMKSW